MGYSTRTERPSFGALWYKLVCAMIAVALVLMFALPMQAFAYFSLSPVSISLGSSSVSITSGSSTSVGLSISPMSEQQLPGCGMSICPQACNGMETPDGVMGGCLNSAGWCTCGGTTYYTAYTQVSASSSNPYVARASANGSTLSITGVSAGTATITIRATLSKHQDASASLTVTVKDSAPAASPAPSTPSGSGQNTGAASSSASSSSSSSAGKPVVVTKPSGSGGGAPSGGGVHATSVGANNIMAAAAQAVAEQNGAEAQPGDGDKVPEVVEIQTEDGDKVVVAEVSTPEDAAARLAEIAGTNGMCTFWSGGSIDSPEISWTFYGQDVPVDADLTFDPSVSVSKAGTGDVAKLLDGCDEDAIVMEFAHSGALPAPADIYVRTSGVLEDGATLGLYCYDSDALKFGDAVYNDIVAADGYAAFRIDHCSTWAISQADLSALEMPAEAAAESDAEFDATTVDVHPMDGTWFIVLAIVVVLAAAGVGGYFFYRKRKLSAIGADADGSTASATSAPSVSSEAAKSSEQAKPESSADEA